jgi:prepilin-type N-terminal cleavage/methylation domain-containing protein
MGRRYRRGGLTLPEVLVTLAIAATLAAVLLPALIGQISKGDAGRLSNDLVAVQTAIGAFTSDVRRFPKDLSQLNTAITISQQDLLNVTYPQSLVNRWRGPYLGKSLTSNTLPTAFGSSIQNAFGDSTTAGGRYLAVTFSPITLADFNNVDRIIDEAASSTTGQLLFVTNNSGTGAFLAVPIQ